MKNPIENDPLGDIPPGHPWFKAIVDLVVELQRETRPSLLAPPGATTNDGRNYDAGRMAMAEDIISRLRVRQSAADKERAE